MNWYQIKFADGDFCRVQAENETDAVIEACAMVAGVDVTSVKLEGKLKLEFYTMHGGERLAQS